MERRDLSIPKLEVPLSVVCFYWLGDRWANDGLGAQYINALYRGVLSHLLLMRDKFEFICFTNEELDGLNPGIVVRKFEAPCPRGVLPRMWMFSEESGLFGRQVLALDLDIVIVDCLADIVSYSGEFCARSKFKPGEQYKLDGDVTSFRAGAENCDRFWKPLAEQPSRVERLTGGRERYWFRYVVGERGGDRWDKVCPRQVVSYKRHVRSRGNQLPEDARIVSCHGNPRPHQITGIPWVRSNWDGRP